MASWFKGALTGTLFVRRAQAEYTISAKRFNLCKLKKNDIIYTVMVIVWRRDFLKYWILLKWRWCEKSCNFFRKKSSLILDYKKTTKYFAKILRHTIENVAKNIQLKFEVNRMKPFWAIMYTVSENAVLRKTRLKFLKHSSVTVRISILPLIYDACSIKLTFYQLISLVSFLSNR